VTTLPGKSWNLVTPFSRPGKSWKQPRSWKVMENEAETAGSQEQLMKLCWTDCFVTLKYLQIRIHTPVVLSYDNSYDEQLEIFLFCSAFINHVSFISNKYAVPIGHGNSFFGHG